MGFISAPVDLSSPAAIGSITPNTGAFTTLSANNGTLTSSSPAAIFTQTWNNAAVTFTGFRASITDTASGSDSLVSDMQVGATSVFSVYKNGWIRTRQASSGANMPYVASSLVIGVDNNIVGRINLGNSINGFWIYNSSAALVAQFGVNNQSIITGTSGIGIGASDLLLFRDAANILAQRNSTNAQTFRLYNTYTDASNYERGFFRWSSNILELGAEAAGTGTQRQLRFPLGTVTASTPLSITQTWNSSGVTFTGLSLDVTNTASANASKLIDLTVGGINRLSITANASDGSAAPAIAFGGSGYSWNLRSRTSSGVGCNFDGVVGIATTLQFGVSTGTGAGDLVLQRDAANIFAQRNSTSAQTFRLYRTYTDASNYERLGFLTTNTTRYTITSQNAGTGSARSLEVSYYTSASDPTSTEITDGCFSVWKNSGTGTIKLWANDGGTMKSVALA